MDIPEKLGLQLTTFCPNGCSWCCSNCGPNGKDIKLNKSLEVLLNNCKYLCLSGGEPFLYKNFPELLKYIKKDVFITVMTSGINPNADEELIERYYKNMHLLKPYFVVIYFTYSDGINPRARLENFLENVDDEYIIVFKVVSQHLEKRKKEIKDMLGDIHYRASKPLHSGRQPPEIIKTNEKCNVFKTNDINIRADGNMYLCKKAIAEIKKLRPYANIYVNTLEEALEKRNIWLEALREFQNKYGNKCETCLNGGFNKFLQDLL